MPFNLKETLEKTEPQLKEVAAMLEQGYFDPAEANIFGTGENQTPLNEDDQNKLAESIKQWRSLSLKEFLEKCAFKEGKSLKEFIAKSGAMTTSGILGSNYLIPVKIYDTLYIAACERDIVPDISAAVLGPGEIPGTTLDVDIAVDDTYYVTKTSTGGKPPEKAITTTKATLDFSNIWNIHFNISRDLIEDSKFSLIELHVRQAGAEMGEYASEQAIVVLAAAADGDGTQNVPAGALGDDTTTLANVAEGYTQNLNDGFVSDIILCSRHVWLDAIMQDVTYSAYNSDFHTDAMKALSYAASDTPSIVFGMKPVFFDTGAKKSTMNPDGDMTEMKTFILTKQYSLLSGRKRWLLIDNYTDPLRDLVGAVVTARQDSVTLYDDSSFEMGEA